MNKSIFKLAALVLLLTACSTSPSKRFETLAANLGLAPTIVDGNGYQHLAWFSDAKDPGHTLHIYLEGDGTPWAQRYRVAKDPTPRNPLMVKLMALDGTPSVYLGRPCYHGLANQDRCNPSLWTSARYSEEVVQTMTAAIQNIVNSLAIERLTLIGHSGGGTLAMLLAERLSQVVTVVTLAGNLDIEAWAKLHGYSPLIQSLNPARRKPLPANILQLHFSGANDNIVPSQLIRAAITHQHEARLQVLENYDHTCCWEAGWADILPRLSTTGYHHTQVK